jgi:hypothetical protein
MLEGSAKRKRDSSSRAQVLEFGNDIDTVDAAKATYR